MLGWHLFNIEIPGLGVPYIVRRREELSFFAFGSDIGSWERSPNTLPVNSTCNWYRDGDWFKETTEAKGPRRHDLLNVLEEDDQLDAACAPFASKKTLLKLARSCFPKVRDIVALYHGRHEYLANILAEDNYTSVRRTLAATTKRADILNRLAMDPENYVRGMVARNKCTSMDILAVLAQDMDADVRQFALERLRERGKLA
jgi:hypothetical protein